SPGYYDVILIAGNQAGTDTIIQNLAVQVYSGTSLNTTSVADTNGLGMGTATVTVAGGVTPYTYTWNDPQQQSTATASGLAAGTYTVTLVDGNGCSSITSILVNNVLVSGVSGLITSKLPYVHQLPGGNWQLIVADNLIGEKFEVFDAVGRLVFKSTIRNPQSEITLSAMSGVYFVKVSSVPGVLKLVKD
ncbi:MAG: T9SS type A sorting domain-containing protein, partial [Bacteroidota bacterium]